MKNYTYDYTNGTGIYLYQRKKVFYINTDTALLVQFMKIRKGERVLDVGTSNGASPLATHRYVPSYLYGIDIQPEAIAVVEKNMKHHHIANIVLMAQDIYDATLEKVGVIVYDPPYFKVNQEGNLSESQSLRMARHERFFILKTLCQRVSELLDEKGRFYIVHRASRVSKTAYTLKQHCLETHTLQFIYDASREEAVSVLVEAVKDGRISVHVLLPQIIRR